MDRIKVLDGSRKSFHCGEQEDQCRQIPSIERQLESLQPTRELLDYYRSKLELHEKEYEILIEKVKKCKILCEGDKLSKDEVTRLHKEVFTLQKALSDLQVYLYQERNQVLKLHSENDKLKIQLAKDRKIINFLLNLCGTTEDHVYYLMNRSDNVDAVGKSQDCKTGRDEDSLEEPEKDQEILKLQVCALKCQLEELKKVSQDEIHLLHQDRELSMLEREKEHENHLKRIKVLSDKLKRIQLCLCNSMQEFLELKLEYSRKEEAWLLAKVSKKQGKLFFKERCEESQSPKRSRKEFKEIKEQLQKKDGLIKQYKDQCTSLEKELQELTSLKLESHNAQQAKLDHLVLELGRMKEKYSTLCRRKALEAEGFRNEVKILKDQIRSLERKLAMDDHSNKVRQKKEMIDTTKAILATTKLLQKELNLI